MTLSPPDIVGVLSVISSAVRVRGQLAGSTVDVVRNGTERIGSKQDARADEIVHFEPGVQLQPGDAISATQSINGQTSNQTPTPTLAQGLVPPFNGHQFISHVFRCGTSLFIAGLVPGAEVHVSAGSSFRGKATAVDGGAVVELSSGTGLNEQLDARQLIQGSLGPSVTSPPAAPVPTLQNFSVDTPRACMPGIEVRNVVDGAEVRVLLERGDPTSQRNFRVPVPVMFLPLPALVAGQELAVQARMERCEIESAALNPDVLPMAFFTRPSIKGPLCAGTRRIQVDNLESGVVVTAKQGNTTVGTAQALEETLEMWVEPLAGGVDLVITATLCGVSVNSYTEPVSSAPVSVGAVHVFEPVFACSMQLFLEQVHPGSYVCAMSAEKGQLSQWRRIAGAEGILDLDSPLQEEHHVWVLQSACGGPPSQSNTVRVEAMPNLESPVIEGPVFADHPVVRAYRVIPGARVQLHSRESGFISQVTADKDGRVTLPKSSSYGVANAGDHLFARQLMCAQITEFGNVEQVVDRTPLAPVITEPLAGATGVSRRPMLRWKDPGVGTLRQAAGFLVEMTHAGNPQFNAPLVLNEVVNGTNKDVGRDLAFSEQIIWRVVAYVGDPGYEVRSPSSTAAFTVAAEPAPPPQLSFSKVAMFNCHNGHRKVKIYQRDVTAGTDWEDVAEPGSQYVNGVCPNPHVSPTMIDLEDGHWHQIVAVDVDMPGCTGDNPDEPACSRFSPLVLLGSDEGPVFWYGIDIGPL